MKAERHEFDRVMHLSNWWTFSTRAAWRVADMVAGTSMRGRGLAEIPQIPRTLGLHKPTIDPGRAERRSAPTAGIAMMLSPSQFGRWMRVFDMDFGERWAGSGTCDPCACGSLRTFSNAHDISATLAQRDGDHNKKTEKPEKLPEKSEGRPVLSTTTPPTTLPDLTKYVSAFKSIQSASRTCKNLKPTVVVTPKDPVRSPISPLFFLRLNDPIREISGLARPSAITIWSV
jgi:hypothetical protein